MGTGVQQPFPSRRKSDVKANTQLLSIDPYLTSVLVLSARAQHGVLQRVPGVRGDALGLVHLLAGVLVHHVHLGLEQLVGDLAAAALQPAPAGDGAVLK